MFTSRSTRGFYDPLFNTYIPEDAVEISVELHASLIAGESVDTPIEWGDDGLPYLTVRPVVWATGKDLSDKVDATIAQVYSTWTRFEAEYVFRENAALAYKAANYTGDVSIWIAAFANSAGIPVRNACDLILSQSVGLRIAQESLGALRMRKYEILPLTEQAALDKYNEIDAAIQQIVSLI